MDLILPLTSAQGWLWVIDIETVGYAGKEGSWTSASLLVGLFVGFAPDESIRHSASFDWLFMETGGHIRAVSKSELHADAADLKMTMYQTFAMTSKAKYESI
ncbi:uncharacterized protein N7479_002697 [Penicillium vulpinum]|uniref:uncharacterized protein n=1 Tax=Penicillium vulpinum TaxID=29845 RepID=UPI002548BCD7|nr:uncharacterized protein N7479_002697 [Penicillium vulpinum]KAJ5972779.1 hypothetical protein N7479_002697 [Penicillium vulpinum]